MDSAHPGETLRGAITERIDVTDGHRCGGRETGDTDGDRRDDRECDLCGEIVPAAVYREHLLKACPGR